MARNSANRRVLRVGVVQGGRIVEELTFSEEARISFGDHEDDALRIHGLDRRAVLFRRRGSDYELNVGLPLEGKVSQGGQVRSLDRLRAELSSGAGAWLPLKGDVRGKVTVGDASLLFQMLQPIAGAHVGGRGPSLSVLRSADRVLLVLLMLSVAMHFCFISLAWAQDPPPTFELVDLPSPIVGEMRRINRPDPNRPPPEPKPAPVKKDLIYIEPKANEDEAIPKVEDPAAELAARQAKVNDSGLLTVIASRGGRASETKARVGDIMANSGGALDDFLKQKAPLKTGSGLRASAGHTVVVEGPDGPEIGAVDIAVAKRVEQGPELAMSPPEALEGGLSAAAIQKVVNGHRSQLRNCHTRELNHNPGLEGRISLHLLIHPDGSLKGVTVAENSTYSVALERCLAKGIRGWRFPAFQGPLASFDLPLVFTAP